jgi:hypothetical protein
MATDGTHELESFHRFLGRQIADGRGGLSPEECLDLWRAQHPDEGILAEDVEAVREALAEMEAGEKGQLFDDFCAQFRQSNKLSQ